MCESYAEMIPNLCLPASFLPVQQRRQSVGQSRNHSVVSAGPQKERTPYKVFREVRQTARGTFKHDSDGDERGSAIHKSGSVVCDGFVFLPR